MQFKMMMMMMMMMMMLLNRIKLVFHLGRSHYRSIYSYDHVRMVIDHNHAFFNKGYLEDGLQGKVKLGILIKQMQTAR
jgi:hypothetical protein